MNAKIKKLIKANEANIRELATHNGIDSTLPVEDIEAALNANQNGLGFADQWTCKLREALRVRKVLAAS